MCKFHLNWSCRSIWRRRFLMVVIVFLLFCYYIPLEKGGVLWLNKLESPSPKYVLCLWTKKCSDGFIRTFSSGKIKRIDACIPQVLVIRDSWDHCDSIPDFTEMWNGKQNRNGLKWNQMGTCNKICTFTPLEQWQHRCTQRGGGVKGRGTCQTPF